MGDAGPVGVGQKCLAATTQVEAAEEAALTCTVRSFPGILGIYLWLVALLFLLWALPFTTCDLFCTHLGDP